MRSDTYDGGSLGITNGSTSGSVPSSILYWPLIASSLCRFLSIALFERRLKHHQARRARRTATTTAATAAPMIVANEVVFLCVGVGLRQVGELKAEVIESETTEVSPFASANATVEKSHEPTCT